MQADSICDCEPLSLLEAEGTQRSTLHPGVVRKCPGELLVLEKHEGKDKRNACPSMRILGKHLKGHRQLPGTSRT